MYLVYFLCCFRVYQHNGLHTLLPVALDSLLQGVYRNNQMNFLITTTYWTYTVKDMMPLLLLHFQTLGRVVFYKKTNFGFNGTVSLRQSHINLKS